MKTNDEVRRLNLLVAIDRCKTASRLGELAETSAAYLSQIKNRAPDTKTKTPKTMGDDIARRIEKAIGEPHGWIDAPHPEDWARLDGGKSESVPDTQPHQVGQEMSQPGLGDILNITAESVDEYRLLIAYRFGGENARIALNATVDEIHRRLASAATKKG